MRRIAAVMIGLACTTMIAACGVENEHPINGTIESVGSGDKDNYRFIKLIDDKNVYTCRVFQVPTCGAVKEDQTVEMIVGDDQDSGIRNTVVSLQFVSSPK